MKLLHLSLLTAASLVVVANAQADEALAKAKNCLACHTVDKKVVGPSYKDVAKKYTAKDEAALAEKIVKGSKGVWGPVPMPPNASVTPEEAGKLAKWILGQK